MSYELFWFGDPWLVQAYAKANELENERLNQQLWLQGLYNFRAFKSVIDAFAYGLGGNKGSKPEGYFDKPIAITEHEKKAQTEQNKQRTLAWVNANQ